MRSAILLAGGLVAAMVIGTQATQAAPRQFWDNLQQKFVTYDIEAWQQGGKATGRTYTPILRQLVDYDGPYGPNTIVIDTAERRLYFVFAEGKAWKYGIGVGREGFQWSGTHVITQKKEWPGWTPPPEMIARERARGVTLPAFMEGGPENPLGARALYIGNTLYRIHGSNQPWTIGHAVSSGCIRMVNDDVIDLYEKVPVGAKVVVLH
jgi:lipoprotein-anchoring transpeptidase ErfK/SrfK